MTNFIIAFGLKEFNDPLTSLVFGAVWFKAGKGTGICSATPNTIGEMIKVNAKTVRRRLSDLVEGGYLADLTPEEKERSRVHDYQVTPLGLSLTGCDADNIMDRKSLRADNEPSNSGQKVPNDRHNTGQKVPSRSQDDAKGQKVPNKGQRVQQKELNNTNQPIKPLEVEQQPQLSHARPAAAAVDPNDDHPDFPDDPKRDQQNQVIDLYRLSFLNPTQFIPPKMLEVLRKDALKYPLPWIERAVEKSITGGKDWRYVQGILKNWLAVGGPENDQKPGGQNGHQNGAGNDTGRNSNRKPEAPSQAAQWEAENGERFRAAVARLTRC